MWPNVSTRPDPSANVTKRSHFGMLAGETPVAELHKLTVFYARQANAQELALESLQTLPCLSAFLLCSHR
jgi:hypothetical protein